MSDQQAIAPAPAWRRYSAAPPLLLVGSILLYVGVALWTGQTRMLETDGVIGLLQRMVGLGIVALGQTFAIIAGSIDLSVANMISVAAVLASLYPVGTILLAAWHLHERPTRRQLTGMVIAAAAVVMITI